jgi:hypothetical protein
MQKILHLWILNQASTMYMVNLNRSKIGICLYMITQLLLKVSWELEWIRGSFCWLNYNHNSSVPIRQTYAPRVGWWLSCCPPTQNRILSLGILSFLFFFIWHITHIDMQLTVYGCYVLPLIKNISNVVNMLA